MPNSFWGAKTCFTNGGVVISYQFLHLTIIQGYSKLSLLDKGFPKGGGGGGGSDVWEKFPNNIVFFLRAYLSLNCNAYNLTHDSDSLTHLLDILRLGWCGPGCWSEQCCCSISDELLILMLNLNLNKSDCWCLWWCLSPGHKFVDKDIVQAGNTWVQ